MAKLGAEVHLESGHSLYVIEIELSCHYPDAEQISHLYTILNDYLVEGRAERSHLVKPPWREISEELYKLSEFRTSDDAWFGYIYLSGNELKFSQLRFALLGFGLPSLLEYLKSKGCIEIKYTISQRKLSKSEI